MVRRRGRGVLCAGLALWLLLALALPLTAARAQGPPPPTDLVQRVPNSTALPVGATLADTGLFFEAVAGKAGGDEVSLEVEVRPIGEAFNGVPTRATPFVPGGAVLSAAMSGLPDGGYHWRLRVVDTTGPSAWVSFGGNPESAADFVVAAPPGTPLVLEVVQDAASGPPYPTGDVEIEGGPAGGEAVETLLLGLLTATDAQGVELPLSIVAEPNGSGARVLLRATGQLGSGPLRFVELRNEARARIPKHNPEWTNYNDSEPGATLLSLLLFLKDGTPVRVKLAAQIPGAQALAIGASSVTPPVPDDFSWVWSFRLDETPNGPIDPKLPLLQIDIQAEQGPPRPVPALGPWAALLLVLTILVATRARARA